MPQGLFIIVKGNVRMLATHYDDLLPILGIQEVQVSCVAGSHFKRETIGLVVCCRPNQGLSH